MGIEKADLFGYEPEEKKEKYQGICGGLVSIILIGAFIGYTINRVVNFIINPSVSYALQYSDTPEDYSVSITNFAFAVVSQSPIRGITDLVSISAVYNTSKNGTAPLVLTPTICEPTGLPSYIYDDKIDFICLDPYVVIPGTIESQIKYQKFMRFVINVTNCSGFMASLPVSLFVVIPDEFEIDLRHRTFENTTGNFIFEQVRLQPPLISNYDLTYQRQDFVMSPDYLLKWTSENRSRLSITKFSNSLNTNAGCVDGTTMIAIIQVSMDEQIQATYIIYETIISMFSQVGALWTTTLLLLGLFFVRLNHLNHYKLKKVRSNNQSNEQKNIANIEIPMSAEVNILSPSDKKSEEKSEDQGTFKEESEVAEDTENNKVNSIP